jgi:hypothetical protein
MLAALAILPMALSVALADDELDAHFAKQASPDGRFALLAIEEDGIVNRVIVKAKDGREVADLTDDVMLSEPESISLLWAKDSQSFAANFRAGGRYNATMFFRWAKDAFTRLESPEARLYETLVNPAKKRELEAAGEPGDAHLRRIWDEWKTTEWDGSVAKIHGESVSSYESEGGSADIAIAVDAAVSFDKLGKSSVREAVEVPARD